LNGDLSNLEAAALGALIAGAIALVGIIVRERALDRHRFTDRKQALYADVWIGCDRHRQQVADQVAWRSGDRTGKGPTVDTTEAIERSCLALDLVASDPIRKAAWALFDATSALGADFARADDDPWVPPPGLWQQRVTRTWHPLAEAFLRLAHDDLRNPK